LKRDYSKTLKKIEKENLLFSIFLALYNVPGSHDENERESKAVDIT